MDLREVGWKGVEWIHMAQDSDQWWAGSIKGREFLE
jgi:hypothetical protein